MISTAGLLSPDAPLPARDRYFAPAVLLPFADEMARRLSRFSTGPLLEIMAGTGVLTQALAFTMSAGMSIVATDPDDTSVDYAARKPGMARVSWQKADPSALPFAACSFGIVACLMGTDGPHDRLGAFSEARRVLRPGGRFVFGAVGSISQSPVSECVQAALEALFPGDAPGFIARGLHGCADHETMDDELTEAGFTEAIYAADELPVASNSAHDLAVGFCLGTRLRAEIPARGEVGAAIRHVAEALEARFGPDRIESTMRVHIVSAAG